MNSLSLFLRHNLVLTLRLKGEIYVFRIKPTYVCHCG